LKNSVPEMNTSSLDTPQFNPRDLVPEAFHVMAKPRGAICNLDCSYCYYSSKKDLYAGSQFRMSEDVLEKYTRQYIEYQHVPEVTFAWQGGEPTLLGLDFFDKALRYQREYRKPGMKINNAFQTNGLLIDSEWAKFFRQHDFLVGVSLDGPEEMHDVYRVDKGGDPTHTRVLKGIRILQEFKVDFNILCCVHKANIDSPLKVYRYLRDDVGAQFIQFIPIVERNNQTGFQEGYKVTRRSISGKKYGNFLVKIFDEWVCNDVGKVFVQIFDLALSSWVGDRAGLCIFEEVCGRALAIEHNGDLYSCDHYVEPRYLLGNIQDDDLLTMVNSKQQIDFGQAKCDGLPKYCRECEVRIICNGGCPKNRIRRTPDGEEGLNYLCEGYKEFFTHISEPMQIMAQLLKHRRPPADIMAMSPKILRRNG
jgi:uncharacterized protein